MNWLARLKKLESTSPPTLQNLQKGDTGAFVGFVGATPSPFQKSAPENGIFMARLSLFTDRGLDMDDAEAMVERLASRDRERDDRRLCLECLHLSGASSARRCSQWQALGIHSPAIPADLATILQRCSEFNSRIEV
jgi:hypothetical protein